MDSVNSSTAIGSPSAESASISLDKSIIQMDYPRRCLIRVNLEKTREGFVKREREHDVNHVSNIERESEREARHVRKI